jgi:hypothetical protein
MNITEEYKNLTVAHTDSERIFTKISSEPIPVRHDNGIPRPAAGDYIDLPQIIEGKAAKRTGTLLDKWKYLEDHRKEEFYKKTDGMPVTITYLGAVAEDLTPIPKPTEYHIYSEDDADWRLDESRRSEIVNRIIRSNKESRVLEMQKDVELKNGYKIKVFDEIEGDQPFKDLEAFIISASTGQTFTKQWYAEKIEKTDKASDWQVKMEETDFLEIKTVLTERRQALVNQTNQLWIDCETKTMEELVKLVLA